MFDLMTLNMIHVMLYLSQSLNSVHEMQGLPIFAGDTLSRRDLEFVVHRVTYS